MDDISWINEKIECTRGEGLGVATQRPTKISKKEREAGGVIVAINRRKGIFFKKKSHFRRG